MVRQQTAHIVFDNSENRAIEGHDDANPNQPVCSSEQTNHHVNTRFSGQRTHEHATSDGGFWISIRHPSMQRRHNRIDADRYQNQPEGQIMRIGQTAYHKIAAGYFEHDAEKQHITAKEVNHDVTETRSSGFSCVIAPNQIKRGDGHQLPEEQKRYPVAGQNHADR